MKTVIYTLDANPAVYCETHADAAVAALAQASIAYSAEQETTNSDCITCMLMDHQIAIFSATVNKNAPLE